MWLSTLVLVGLVIVLLLAYSKYRHNYWASRRIPTFPGTTLILGHIHHMFSKGKAWEYVNETYKNHGGFKMCGYYEFFTPRLVVGDPDLAKNIFIKDFDHFVDRRNFRFTSEDDNIMNHFLTNATGAHWKGVRSVLSPSFTSGRMKDMFPLIAKKADAFVEYVHKNKKEDCSVELKKSFGLYTLEVIASCAFGMESGTLEDENSIFAVKCAGLSKVRFTRILKIFAYISFPKLCQSLGISLLQPEMHFFADVVKRAIVQREAGFKRGDFLDLMIEAKQDLLQNPSSKIPKYPLTENNVVANSVLFIIAGFDTTATTLSFMAYDLAKHPHIQEKLRKEIRNIIDEKGELNYQDIMEAKYLDACMSETLRRYPPAHITERQCTKEYRFPGTDVVISPKMTVGIPIFSIHHDERYWSNPKEFQPERFLPENKENIRSGTYLPFGLGPRNCIGMRFAQMEAKLAIAKSLLDFQFELAPGSEEIQYNQSPGIMRPAEDFRLVFKPLVKIE